MATLCDTCLRIFQTGVSPLGLTRTCLEHSNGLHILRSSRIRLHFPHHPSVGSLQKSGDEGCYICLLLIETLMRHYSVAELPSLYYDKSFTKYRYATNIQESSQHLHHPFEAILSYDPIKSYDGPGSRFVFSRVGLAVSVFPTTSLPRPSMSVMAFPAPGMWRKFLVLV
jgi:hypothetical protein